jgi:hypothetical protein
VDLERKGFKIYTEFNLPRIQKQWQTLVSMVLNFRVQREAGKLTPSSATIRLKICTELHRLGIRVTLFVQLLYMAIIVCVVCVCLCVSVSVSVCVCVCARAERNRDTYTYMYTDIHLHH